MLKDANPWDLMVLDDAHAAGRRRSSSDEELDLTCCIVSCRN